MSVKYDVLNFLENNRGQRISGAALARQLGVTRNSVWKAVNSLRLDGYAIDALTNAGYMLPASTDMLSAQSIKKYLSRDYEIQVHRSVGSTNDVLKALAVSGAAEGTIVIAEEQTKGKGRLGRSFHSAPATGIYMSLLLRPKFSAEEALSITTAAAVAVAEGIESASGKKTKIKWVNDVYLEGKKVCGILTEASINFENGGLEYAVLGIGINVRPPEQGFPADIKDVAGAIFEGEPSGDMRSRLAAAVIEKFFAYYAKIPDKGYLVSYRNRSYLTGKDVVMTVGMREESGTVVDIDENARLLLRMRGGEMKAFSAGEANIKKGTIK